MEYVSIDHFTWSTVADDDGFCAILTIKCEFTKHISAIPVKTYSHTEVIFYLRMYQMLLGKIQHLHCDNYFDSKEFVIYCEEE